MNLNGPETSHTTCKLRRAGVNDRKQVDAGHHQFGLVLLQGRRPPGCVDQVAARKMVVCVRSRRSLVNNTFYCKPEKGRHCLYPYQKLGKRMRSEITVSPRSILRPRGGAVEYRITSFPYAECTYRQQIRPHRCSMTALGRMCIPKASIDAFFHRLG